MSEQPPKTPKIIVDEDWKTQVREEREALEAQRRESEAQEPSAGASQEDTELPPASFSLLVTTLAAQTVAALGRGPDAEKPAAVRLDAARHYIDTLDMLEEKTKGNLTREESALLTNVLYELRMAFVASRKPAPPSDKP